MKSTNSLQRLAGITIGSLLAALLLSGCDQPRDMPEPPNIPEKQQMGSDAPPQSPGQSHEDSIAQSVPATAHELDTYAQKAQEPDRDRSNVAESDEAQQFAMVKKAVAEVTPTAKYEATGTVTFSPGNDSNTMNIQVALSGLTPGKHGLHIHQNGNCSADDAASAGAHFNPYQAQHGAPQLTPHHAGDLGNIEADANGRVNTTLTVAELAFSGPTSVLEKAIIVHAQADDLQTDPAGNSGDRAGCGVVRPAPDLLAAESVKNKASSTR